MPTNGGLVALVWCLGCSSEPATSSHNLPFLPSAAGAGGGPTSAGTSSSLGGGGGGNAQGLAGAGQSGTGGTGIANIGGNASGGAAGIGGSETTSNGGAGIGGVGGGGFGGGGGTAGGNAAPSVRMGCESVMHDGHLYALCRDKKVPFPDARKDCEAMHLQLIRLDSAAESDWIYATFYARPTTAGGDGAQMWVGATDTKVEGEWRWLIGGDLFWSGKADGQVVGGLYANWGRAHGVGTPDQPNDDHSAEGEDCMVIRAPAEMEAGHWTDIGCGAENSPPVPEARLGWYTCEAP